MLRQLYYTDAEFKGNFRRFLEQHPPTGGTVTDLDHGRRTMTVPEVLHYLNIT